MTHLPVLDFLLPVQTRRPAVDAMNVHLWLSEGDSFPSHAVASLQHDTPKGTCAMKKRKSLSHFSLVCILDCVSTT